MIVPKNDDRTWTKPMWKYLQRYSRCVNRIISPKLEKAMIDQLIYGQGQYEITADDSQSVTDLMLGKKPQSPKTTE